MYYSFMPSNPTIISVYHGQRMVFDKPAIFKILQNLKQKGCKRLAVELTEYPFKGVNDFSRIADEARKIGFEIAAIDSPECNAEMQRMQKQKMPIKERMARAAYIGIVRERHMVSVLKARPCDVILVNQTHAIAIRKQIPARVIRVTPIARQSARVVKARRGLAKLRKQILKAEEMMKQKARSRRIKPI